MTTSLDFRTNGLRNWNTSLPAEARLLTWHAAAMFTFFVVCLVLQITDDRIYNGASIWLKPGKFFASFRLHMLTIAFAISVATQHNLNLRALRPAVTILLVANWFELIYISSRASQGAPSHFDISAITGIALFAMMAIAAVSLVSASAYIGYLVWKSNPRSLMHKAIVVAFGLSAVLTTIVGLRIGENLGPWIGGQQTNAGGLPIFRWSTTGGDLRVSHFFSTHIAQLVPLAALTGQPRIVWGTAALATIATIATFVQAQAGLPLTAF